MKALAVGRPPGSAADALVCSLGVSLAWNCQETLIPKHSAASFVVVLFPEFPHQLGPSAKEPVAEFHYRASRRRRTREGHAEPIRRYIEEFPPEPPCPAWLNKAYLALTGDARIHPPIPHRLSPARVRKRNPEEAEVGYSRLLDMHVGTFVLSIGPTGGRIKADHSWLPEVKDPA